MERYINKVIESAEGVGASYWSVDKILIDAKSESALVFWSGYVSKAARENSKLPMSTIKTSIRFSLGNGDIEKIISTLEECIFFHAIEEGSPLDGGEILENKNL